MHHGSGSAIADLRTAAHWCAHFDPWRGLVRKHGGKAGVRHGLGEQPCANVGPNDHLCNQLGNGKEEGTPRKGSRGPKQARKQRRMQARRATDTWKANGCPQGLRISFCAGQKVCGNFHLGECVTAWPAPAQLLRSGLGAVAPTAVAKMGGTLRSPWRWRPRRRGHPPRGSSAKARRRLPPPCRRPP